MKKLLFTALVAVSLSATAFSQDVASTDQRIVDNFEATYTDATKVEWVSTENFTKALFIQNGHNFSAYYNPSGEFMATTSQVDLKEVPTFVKIILAKKYSDYNVTQAFELMSDDETAYFIAGENETQKIVLKVQDGTVSVFDKTAKL